MVGERTAWTKLGIKAESPWGRGTLGEEEAALSFVIRSLVALGNSMPCSKSVGSRARPTGFSSTRPPRGSLTLDLLFNFPGPRFSCLQNGNAVVKIE